MRKVANIFEPKASRILRTLLVDPDRRWTLRGLAGEVSISVGYTHAVVSRLLDSSYVTWTDDRFLMTIDPKRLLRRWAAYNQYDATNRFIDYYALEREIDRFIRKLGKIEGHRYALTALAGASLVAAYARPVDVHFYVRAQGEVTRVARELDLKPVPKGGNVKLVIPYDEGVFYGSQVVDGVTVVSDVQLYVDLYNYPSRGEEAAQYLYDRILRKWARTLEISRSQTAARIPYDSFRSESKRIRDHLRLS